MNKDIEITASKHDKYQVELKNVYPFNRSEQKNRYFFDVFFFIPRNLAVNPQTFSGREFYNDFSEYTRFKTPEIKLSELADENVSVLARLKQSLGSELYLQTLKMFCSIAKVALRDCAFAIYAAQLPEREKMLNEYVKNASQALKNFRVLKQSLSETDSGTDSEKQFFELVDEFLSITSSGYLFRLWHRLKESNNLSKTEIETIAKFTAAETEYREQAGFYSVPSRQPDSSELLYRESVLKKSMADVLFLKTDTRKDGMFLETLILGTCAGLAMIFVTAISFIWKGLFLEEFSLSFFIVWVIAYMFKDRIKSLLQLYFMNTRWHYAYDYRKRIYDSFGNIIGICHEGFHHCDGSDITSKVEQTRGARLISKLENGSLKENVIVYRKKITLHSDSCKNIFREFNVNGVTDILRLNIRHWLNKMDNPNKIVYTSDGKEITELTAKRVYHINMVLRYGKKDENETFDRYRIIANRDGIVSIEKVAE